LGAAIKRHAGDTNTSDARGGIESKTYAEILKPSDIGTQYFERLLDDEKPPFLGYYF